MNGYVFIENSTKPTEEKYRSRDAVKISNVSRPCLKTALDMGYDVYLGINRENPEDLECELPIKLYDAHTYRSLTAIKDNWIAYRNLCKVIKEGNIQVIHCNTPIGGMIGRICGKKYNVDKVIYTAHGFHFYKGAPLFNRTVLKWAEQFMAHWTDAIITMNQEDFEAAKKFKLKKGGKVFFVHGVGINLSEFERVENQRQEKRMELNIADDDIVLISMGDLVANKNYSTAIHAIAKVANPHLHYMICGSGPELEPLQKLSKELNIEEQIHFLGFRTDIKGLLTAADFFLFTTKREGLPRSMMEAMASGLPCIVSNIRGNVDLIEDNLGGYLCMPDDVGGFADAIKQIAGNRELCQQMSTYNLEKIKEFDVSIVEKEIQDIYKAVLST